MSSSEMFLDDLGAEAARSAGAGRDAGSRRRGRHLAGSGLALRQSVRGTGPNIPRLFYRHQ